MSETQTWKGTPALIKVTVQGYLTFKGLVGKRQISMSPGSNLQDLLFSLCEELGEPFKEQAYNPRGELREHVAVLLNGKHYKHLPDVVNTVLEDGDQVAIFPPMAGG